MEIDEMSYISLTIIITKLCPITMSTRSSRSWLLCATKCKTWYQWCAHTKMLLLTQSSSNRPSQTTLQNVLKTSFQKSLLCPSTLKFVNVWIFLSLSLSLSHMPSHTRPLFSLTLKKFLGYNTIITISKLALLRKHYNYYF